MLMKKVTNLPNDKKIRPEIWMIGGGLVGAVLIVGIFGLHSHWFDRYDSGADKSLTSITVTNVGQPEVPAGFVQEAPQPEPVVQEVIMDEPTNTMETITFSVRPRFSSVAVAVPETNNNRFASNSNKNN